MNVLYEAWLRRLDADILADHADGRHWKYDTVDGCTFFGCDDAFWRWSFDIERGTATTVHATSEEQRAAEDRAEDARRRALDAERVWSATKTDNRP